MPIDCEKTQLHEEIFRAALAESQVPTSVYGSPEKILSTVVDGITKANNEQATKGQHYLMMMLTRYEYHPSHGQVGARIRVLSFEIDSTMINYAITKDGYTHVKLDLRFDDFECDFDDHAFGALSANTDQYLINKGMQIAAKKNTDISMDQ